MDESLHKCVLGHCVQPSAPGLRFCTYHYYVLERSPERKRADAIAADPGVDRRLSAARCVTAVDDFVRRSEAEHRNGTPATPEPT